MRTDELLDRAIAPGSDRHGPCMAVWFIDRREVAVEIANKVIDELAESMQPKGLDYSVELNESRRYFIIHIYVRIGPRFVKPTLQEEQLIAAEIRSHLKAHHMATGIVL